KLRLYVTTNGSIKGGSAAKMSNTSWGETTVTYNNGPAIDGPVLSTLGAVSTNTWYEFDVTGAVAGDGLLTLGINTTSSDGVRYASRENTGFAPQLVVTLTPGDTIPPGTNITGGPSGLVATSSASFAFSANETGSSFACRLRFAGHILESCRRCAHIPGAGDGRRREYRRRRTCRGLECRHGAA